jgi:hypothetical protein
MTKLEFERCPRTSYAARTEINCRNADATIAVAANFKTAGERLTKVETLLANKLYRPVDVSRGLVDPFQVARSLIGRRIETLNFAGNGIYTMSKYGWSQDRCDEYARELLAAIMTMCPLMLVRSGGQTGFDEAGAKAAAWLGVPRVLVYAPKDWSFRTADGVDVHDEAAFKRRFLT